MNEPLHVRITGTDEHLAVEVDQLDVGVVQLLETSPGHLIQNPHCRSSRKDTCSQNEVGMPVGGEHSAGFDDTSLVFAVIELRHGAR
nr:hypothetical protein [Nocardia abscessus]